jgi:hypothetical protein
MRDFDDDEWNRREREEWRRLNEQDVWITTGNANRGDAEAQNRLGYYYTVGHGSLEVDLTQAVYWYGAERAKTEEQNIEANGESSPNITETPAGSTEANKIDILV